MAIIKDGSAGFTAGVNSHNQLQTHSVSLPAGVDATELGKGWNLNTGQMTITGDGSIMYIKNTEEASFTIEAIAFAFGDGITFTDFPNVHLEKNPIGGTIITDATPLDMEQNRNFSYSDDFGGLAYKGGTGKTLTGGDGHVAEFMLNKTGRSFFNLNFVLPKQSSLGIELHLNGSGSATLYAAVIGYYHKLHGE